MSRTKWKVLVINLLLSCTSLAFYVTSISSDNWINASAFLTDRLESNINYGLFSGRLYRHQLATTLRFDIHVSCDFSKDACFYSCQNSASERQDELQRIHRGEELRPCEQAGRMKLPSLHTFPVINSNNTAFSRSLETNGPGQKYMNASLWLCTVIFLILSIIFTALASVLVMLNLYYNLVEPMLNVFGLYFWNSAAATWSFLTLSIWGVLFGSYLSSNIAITDTLRHELTFSSAGLANLGFSFYMVIAGLVLNVLNVGVLFLNRFIDQKMAGPSTITVDQIDTPVEFY